MASLSNERRRKHVFASLYSIPTQDNCKIKSAGTHILILREEVFQMKHKNTSLSERKIQGDEERNISLIFLPKRNDSIQNFILILKKGKYIWSENELCQFNEHFHGKVFGRFQSGDASIMMNFCFHCFVIVVPLHNVINK